MFFNVFPRKTLKALQNRCFLAENVKKPYKINVFFKKPLKNKLKSRFFQQWYGKRPFWRQPPKYEINMKKI